MSDKYPFGTFGPEHLKKVESGIECFNTKKYWECHEELEDVWLEDRNDPARLIYWAIIQVAASMYHVREKNLVGAQGMLKKAQNKLTRAKEQNVVTDLVLKYLSWEEFSALVNGLDVENSQLDSFEDLYQFKFLNYQSEIV